MWPAKKRRIEPASLPEPMPRDDKEASAFFAITSKLPYELNTKILDTLGSRDLHALSQACQQAHAQDKALPQNGRLRQVCLTGLRDKLRGMAPMTLDARLNDRYSSVTFYSQQVFSLLHTGRMVFSAKELSIPQQTKALAFVARPTWGLAHPQTALHLIPSLPEPHIGQIVETILHGPHAQNSTTLYLLAGQLKDLSPALQRKIVPHLMGIPEQHHIHPHMLINHLKDIHEPLRGETITMLFNGLALLPNINIDPHDDARSIVQALAQNGDLLSHFQKDTLISRVMDLESTDLRNQMIHKLIQNLVYFNPLQRERIIDAMVAQDNAHDIGHAMGSLLILQKQHIPATRIKTIEKALVKLKQEDKDSYIFSGFGFSIFSQAHRQNMVDSAQAAPDLAERLELLSLLGTGGAPTDDAPGQALLEWIHHTILHSLDRLTPSNREDVLNTLTDMDCEERRQTVPPQHLIDLTIHAIQLPESGLKYQILSNLMHAEDRLPNTARADIIQHVLSHPPTHHDNSAAHVIWLTQHLDKMTAHERDQTMEKLHSLADQIKMNPYLAHHLAGRDYIESLENSLRHFNLLWPDTQHQIIKDILAQPLPLRGAGLRNMARHLPQLAAGQRTSLVHLIMTNPAQYPAAMDELTQNLRDLEPVQRIAVAKCVIAQPPRDHLYKGLANNLEHLPRTMRSLILMIIDQIRPPGLRLQALEDMAQGLARWGAPSS